MSDGLTIVKRPGRVRCPYCHDLVASGCRCWACKTRYHRDCASLLDRCAVLGCPGRAEAQWSPPLRHARRYAPNRGPQSRRWVRTLLTGAGVGSLAVFGLWLAGLIHAIGHKGAYEAHAIQSLKQIATAQSLTREGHAADCCYPKRYATLAELGRPDAYADPCARGDDYAGKEKLLIDADLASGKRLGYVFEARPGVDAPELTWIATARPQQPGVTGDHYFALNHEGVVHSRTSGPYELTDDASIPVDVEDVQ